MEPDTSFCPACGQVKKDVNQPFKFIFNDFVNDLLNFDSKFFKTFIPLLFRPGFLTSEFVKGRRVRYVAPIRLYLIASFIFFGLTSVIYSDSDTEKEPKNISFNVKDKGDTFLNYFKKEGTPEMLLDTFKLEHSKINTYFAKQGLKMLRDDGKSFKQKLFENISLMMFVLMPFFAIVLALVNIKKKLYFTTHMVFSYHIHSFLFIILSIGVIISEISDNELFIFGLAIWTIYYFIRMFRKIYPGRPVFIFLKLMVVAGLHSFNLLILFLLNILFTALLL